MLADVRGRDFGDDDYRWITREFMDLIIRSYNTQLEEGYSILVVKSDFSVSKTDNDADARSSYRVNIIPFESNVKKNGRRRATA